MNNSVNEVQAYSQQREMKLQRKTKAEILQGVHRTQTVPVEEYGIEMIIRPLRESEASEVDALELEGIDFDFNDMFSGKKQFQHMSEKEIKNNMSMDDMKMDMDLKKITEAESKANRHIVAYSLSVQEEWTVDEAKQLDKIIFNKVLEAAKELSGLSSQAQDMIKNFR
jgi:hypothetical protein